MSSTKCIYIIGPSSTGKTTLCRALAANLDLPRTAHVAEVARTVMREQGFTRDDVGTFAMQVAIFAAQLEQESLAKARRPPVLLFDRSAMDPIVYSGIGVSQEDKVKRRKDLLGRDGFNATLEDYRQSLFVLLLPVEDWIFDDGVRSLEEPWNCAHHFKAVLKENAVEFKELGGDVKGLQDRVNMVSKPSCIPSVPFVDSNHFLQVKKWAGLL